ncbi:unnamed protein product [Somion occarium]|uniref:Serine-rich protein n=1 Tax=Somion occarium TaxID=3059160 RepID=A0ABP1E3Z3_9APHY
MVSKTPERTSPSRSRSGTRDDLHELPSRFSFTGGRPSSSRRSHEENVRGSSHRLSLSCLPQHLSTPAKWSTFGRPKGDASKAARFTPPPSARHSRMGSMDSTAQQRPASRRTQRSSKLSSTTSVNRLGNPSLVSSIVAPSHSPSSTVSKSSSARYIQEQHAPQSPSPPLTNSSRQNSTINSVAPSSPSSRSNQGNTTSSNDEFHSFIMDSPGTFGDATPPQGADYHPPSATPPALPPFRHPDLISSLSTRSAISTLVTTSIHAFPTGPQPQLNPAMRGRTYPLRQTTRELIHRDENTPISYPARSLRGSASLPRIQEIFPQGRRRERAASSRRRSHSTSSRRRVSAELISHQAAVGVTSEHPHEFGWPAEVSREILRLSLGEMSGRGSQNGTERRRLQRGIHVPAPASNSLLPCSPPSNLPSPPHLLSGPFTSPTSPEDPDFGATIPRGGSSLITLGSEVEGEGDTGIMAERNRRLSSRASGELTIRETATIPRSSSANRTTRKSILNIPTNHPLQAEAGPSTPDRPTGLPLPHTPKTPPTRPKRSSSEPGLTSVLETPTNNSKGKRKAEEVDITPPDQKNGHRATFVIPENDRRNHRQSESSLAPSRAPSSYQRKRVRLSTPSPGPSPGHSRPDTSQNATDTGSWSSRTSGPPPALGRAASHAASIRSAPPSTLSAATHPQTHSQTQSQSQLNEHRRPERRRSMSEMSIPISALIAPHAPSVSRSSTYHMRDPRRPPPTRPTSWTLHLKSEDEDASPFHAWCFFIGFVLFPIWWIASFAPIPRTRQVGGTDTEKAVTLDDPRVEHDARSWRFRCRIMSGISFLTYIPFIILVAIFVPR